MRKLNPFLSFLTLGLTLTLVAASAYQPTWVPLAAVALASLGGHAAILFAQHRAKLSRLLGPRAQILRFRPESRSDLDKAA